MNMDLGTAMKARAVCTSWKRHVREADLEPLEAEHLEVALALENQIWTPQHTSLIAQHLSKQQEVSQISPS